jgi:ABC-type nitrate/sulfonate/bicarbonate transport system permease component
MSVATHRMPAIARKRPAIGRWVFRAPVVGLLPILLGLVVWQVVGDPGSTSFPPPSSWLSAIRELYRDGTLMPALGHTLLTFVLSLLVATILGAAVGVAVGGSERLDRALTPLMDIFRALPPPVVVPVTSLVLGATQQAAVGIVAFAIVWPILLNTAAAMRAIPPVRVEMSRALGLARGERLVKVIFPSLLPAIGLGVKIAVAISLVVTLLVDILGAGDGAGRLILERQQTYDPAGVFGLLAIIGAFGFLANAAVGAGEDRILRNWKGGR